MFDRKECPHISGMEQENETNRIKSQLDFQLNGNFQNFPAIQRKWKLGQKIYGKPVVNSFKRKSQEACLNDSSH